MPNEIVLRVDSSMVLPDNDQWTNRFEIHSSSSNRVYVIAQNKKGKYIGCSCPGWKRFRHCKHLDSLGLPGDMKPVELKLR